MIIVNNWDELQYYCSLTDKDYTLKLKENTNFYPDPTDFNSQIKINNNVRIIGSQGAYFGDTSPHRVYIDDTHHTVIDNGEIINSYNPIVVPDNSKIGITLENITFKWIYIKN